MLSFQQSKWQAIWTPFSYQNYLLQKDYLGYLSGENFNPILSVQLSQPISYIGA